MKRYNKDGYHAEHDEGVFVLYEDARREIDELNAGIAKSEAQRKLLTNLVDAAVLAIGEHNAPSDCYTPTTLTGNAVVCPACRFISMLEALAKLEER